MDIAEIDAAVHEAEKFVARARDLMHATMDGLTQETGVKERGALRRQSMELTRALAAMRKP